MDKCNFQNLATGKISCSLGFYGGSPFLGNCLACIHLGHNTPEYAAELKARSATAHPAAAGRVSGCCDSARNYTDRI